MLERWWKTMLLRLHINNSSINCFDYLSWYFDKTPTQRKQFKTRNLYLGYFMLPEKSCVSRKRTSRVSMIRM